MSDEAQPNVIALLTSDNPAEREQGLALAPNAESITLDGSTLQDLAGANLLGQLPKLTSVTLTVGEHSQGHIATILGHLQQNGVAAEAIRVSGDFGGEEWLDARRYSWTKYFEVDEINAYISECEGGTGLQFSLCAFTLVPVAEHDALANLVAQLTTGLSESEINISRDNGGGNTYICEFSPLQTVVFYWEEMNEESSEFDCSDWDEWEKFTKMISDAGLSLSQGFFYNEWSGNQVDQEDWWFSDFEFPSAEIITLNWAPEA